jgi:hypothetical protein
MRSTCGGALGAIGILHFVARIEIGIGGELKVSAGAIDVPRGLEAFPDRLLAVGVTALQLEQPATC